MIGISHSSEKRAIIDIGSNTVRMVVYNGPPRAPVVILNEKVNARLGRDLGKTGAINDKSMKTALVALARFSGLLRLLDVKDVECVATAAARDASNGKIFLDAVRQFGLSPRLLSGEEEARASATGVIAAFPGAHGVAADLGGGSLELVEIAEGRSTGGITLPFGTLLLPDLRAAGESRFSETVHKALDKAGWGDPHDAKGRGQPLYIVGGSWRALALQAMRALDFPVDDPHGFELPASEALRLARIFAKGKLNDVDPRISASRLATLPDAAALMVEVIARLKPSKLVFSSWGLREGLLHAQLPAEIQAQDPMLASVAGFSASARVTADDAMALARWTAPVCREEPQDRQLRQASGLLALAAMRTEPNLRTEEAMTWALRKRWIGLDMHGRGMMAMTVFANSGQTEVPEQFTRLAVQEDLDRAIGWGLAVRLCRRLTGCSAQGLAQSAVRSEDGKLVLTLSPAMRPLYSPGVAKDHKALADWLGLACEVRDSSGLALVD
ncbi:exopolyphosphatase/guanosine-5'-triphosphate,3'-diphosphate pyrophosphatase [Novosphingobium sp. PhB57]|uniref:Ppx/GppA family phosphatase n=1 Tax=Novosphingobium sp. PhB57 TaxID=2485107 RepID=UPI0010540A11|nr:Ppx/GppA family phosphatase [Novosphingobium sp. PhB57]TCU62182.1 exopolyphosphatase/guanosine-5'-triphosphate,3'-diphosphate pyrophosphatase [Novosphingobium sp. PhB57]